MVEALVPTPGVDGVAPELAGGEHGVLEAPLRVGEHDPVGIDHGVQGCDPVRDHNSAAELDQLVRLQIVGRRELV